MAELISMTYKQARAEHFKTLKDEAKHKMNYWATRVRRSRPNDLNDPAHIRAGEYAAEYSYYKDALEALENQQKWISIKEQLPTRELRVLTINGHGLIRIFGFFKRTEKAWTWIDDAGHFNHCNDITHWMPLPSTKGIE